ncbi:MAG: GTPase ObgE [Armatimonadota bacterium]|nr:GTPase ObgE [Armatimonadota bacterium]
MSGFIDEARINVRAGDGGDGVVSFRREAFEPRGGPNGGDGGDGGDVYLQVKDDMRTLLDFEYRNTFRAEDGRMGSSKKHRGRDGRDTVIPVPPGTVVYDLDLGEQVCDLTHGGQRLLVARGGKGGRGNASFATPSRQAPRFCQLGAPGEERHLRLELKLLADVGIIGYPNVGKSSFISRVSAAKPEVAAYPFTTLQPNLGVVQFEDFTTMVIADMPGLIVGAHEGVGLGDRFLRHIERTKLLVHMVDASGLEGRDLLQDFREINRELEMYDARLARLEQVVALNKMDLPQGRERAAELREALEAEGYAVFAISAATGEGTRELLDHLRERLFAHGHEVEPEPPDEEEMELEIPPLPRRPLRVRRLDGETMGVTGTRIEKLAATVDMEADEAVAWFQQQLEEQGVLKALREAGVEEGDTVVIGAVEFVYTTEEATK